jgi:hypothetical protein
LDVGTVPTLQCGLFLLDVGTVPTLQCGIFLLDVGTVPKVWYFSIGFWNFPIKKYNTVGTVPTSNRKIQHCWNSSKIQ